MENTQSSEVSRLLQSIREEYEAATRGLSGFAPVGQHAFLTKRMECIAQYHQELRVLVGDQAMPLIAEATNNLPDTPSAHLS